MTSPTNHDVHSDHLCRQCETSDFHFNCTDDLVPPQGLISQDRALKTIQCGLEVENREYNLFVTGLTGTDKASAIKRHIQTIIDERSGRGVQSSLHDWCYVHNLEASNVPHILNPPTGKERLLVHDLFALLNTLWEKILKLFSSEEHIPQWQHLERRAGPPSRLDCRS